MDNTATLPTDVPTLHLMLREQQQLIESLKANLHRLLKWRFGPKSESVDVDQCGLFADGSLVIEVPPPEPAAEAEKSTSSAACRASSSKSTSRKVRRSAPAAGSG